MGRETRLATEVGSAPAEELRSRRPVPEASRWGLAARVGRRVYRHSPLVQHTRLLASSNTSGVIKSTCPMTLSILILSYIIISG